MAARVSEAVGEGPHELLVLLDPRSEHDDLWDVPAAAEQLRALADVSKVVLCTASDRAELLEMRRAARLRRPMLLAAGAAADIAVRLGTEADLFSGIILANAVLEPDAVEAAELLPPTVPVLVIHRKADNESTVERARNVKHRSANARIHELDGVEHEWWDGDPTPFVSEIAPFITEQPLTTQSPRQQVVATVLYTDIVGSTAKAAELGDEEWRDLLDRHDEVMRRELTRTGGEAVNHTGDGFLCVFDTPGGAVRAALGMHRALAAIGVRIRAGVHTGECERRDGRLAGVTLHIGARVASAGGAGDVIVSNTVRDLLAGAGSSLRFDDRGVHTLKGVPGEWRLFNVPDQDSAAATAPPASTGSPPPAKPPKQPKPPKDSSPRAARSRLPLLGGAAVAVLAVLAIAAFLVTRGGSDVPDLPAPRTVWKAQISEYVSARSVADAQRVYVPTTAGLRVVSLANGAVLDTIPVPVAPDLAPALGDGVISVISSDGALHARRTDNSTEAWPAVRASRPFVTTPVLVDGVLYVGNEDGNLYAVDARSGAVRWKFDAKSPVSAAPAVGSGIVVVPTQSGQVFAVDLATHQERWRVDTGTSVYPSPLVAGDKAYVVSGNRVFGVAVTDGSNRWEPFVFKEQCDVAPALAAGILAVGCDDKKVHGIDIATGDDRWEFFTAGTIESDVVAVGEVFVAASSDGGWYGFAAGDSAGLWRIDTDSSASGDPLVNGNRVIVPVASGVEMVDASPPR